MAVAASAVPGLVYGMVASRLPAPHDVHAFWLGNLCVPWVVLPFGVGSAHRTARRAVGGGVVATVACVLAFYGRGLTADPFRLGLAAATPVWRVVLVSVVRQILLARVWLIAAMVVGAAMGWLGWRWWTLGERFLIVVPLAAALVEPLCWRVYEGFLPRPTWIWVLEVVASLGLMAASCGASLRQCSRTTAPAIEVRSK